jgi:hypothetical protein
MPQIPLHNDPPLSGLMPIANDRNEQEPESTKGRDVATMSFFAKFAPFCGKGKYF